MRIIVLATSKNICSLLKEIFKGIESTKYDCVEKVEDLNHYLDIRNYDYVVINSEEIDVDNELLEKLVELSVLPKKLQTLYVKAKSEGKLNNLERAKLLDKGIFYSIDEDEYTKDYIETVFNSSINVSKNESVLREGKLLVDIRNETIFYGDHAVTLEGKPFEVLVLLLKRKNEIITKEELLNSIWEEPEMVTPNVVDVCIHIIRQKIDKPFNISTIETVQRRGVRFALKD